MVLVGVVNDDVGPTNGGAVEVLTINTSNHTFNFVEEVVAFGTTDFDVNLELKTNRQCFNTHSFGPLYTCIDANPGAGFGYLRSCAGLPLCVCVVVEFFVGGRGRKVVVRLVVFYAGAVVNHPRPGLLPAQLLSRDRRGWGCVGGWSLAGLKRRWRRLFLHLERHRGRRRQLQVPRRVGSQFVCVRACACVCVRVCVRSARLLGV